ncbi:MAG TPA: hypothetical protein PLH19_00720 [Anaerolineae bacterium]|nr:hypothetical protein [Anaerolineae bacterium]HQH37042.1 hypothetical protein [Anaerolineae bacterium]
MAHKKWLYPFFVLQLLFVSLIGAFFLLRSYSNIQQADPSLPAVAAATHWTGVATPVTLADAATRAGIEAQAWANDAALSRVEATWRPGDEWIDIESPPVSWSFYYYSPAHSAVMSVAVQGEEVLPTPATMLPYSPTLLSGFPPPQGVEVAWLTFRAAGGEDFLQAHSGAAVQFRLQMASGKPTWFILAFTPQARLQISIDAETGLLFKS